MSGKNALSVTDAGARLEAVQALLAQLHKTFLRKEYLDGAVRLLRRWSGCSCAGIRVITEDGMVPYESYLGFSREFREAENRISVVHDDCVCTRIISGKKIPADRPMLTCAGSFRCDDTAEFLRSLAPGEKSRFRGKCLEHGFRSLAVIPVRYGEKILGAIHLADDAAGKVTAEGVEFIESLTPVLGEALHKFTVVDKLRQNYDTQSIVNSILALSLENMSRETLLRQVLEMILSIPWLGIEPRGAIFTVDEDPGRLVMKAHQGLPERIRRECARVALGRCVCGQAALNKRLTFTASYSEGHENPLFGAEETHGHYCVPVLSGGELLGLITIYVKEGYEPDKRKESFLMAISHALAGVLRRKRTEEELNTTHEILERIFSSMHLLIAFMDPRFNFLQVNRAYAAADGKTPDFFPGRNHFALYPDGDNEQIFRRVVETGEGVTVYAKPFVYKANPERGTSYWDWSLQPVKSAAGEIEGLILIVVDVTERKRAEENLRRVNAEFEQSKRLADIGMLAAKVAHELRNPLGVMKIAVYNIKKKNENSLLDKHLANIEKKILQSDQIINNLLFYSRIRMPRFEPAAILRVIDECIAAAKARFAGWDVNVKKQYKCRRGTVLEADALQMSELFSNVINNAFESFASKKGNIVIRAACLPENGRFLVTVKDDGAGIEPVDLKKVFEPFFSKKPKGTGLGLTVCDQIVKFHEGTLGIDSAPGKGTTVTVVLPLKRKIQP